MENNKRKQIAEFYKQIFSDEKLKERLKEKAKKIASEEDLRKLIREEIMTLMKKFKVNFSEEELFEFEKGIQNEMSDELSDESLEGVTGGLSARSTITGGLLALTLAASGAMALGQTSYAAKDGPVSTQTQSVDVNKDADQDQDNENIDFSEQEVKEWTVETLKDFVTTLNDGEINTSSKVATKNIVSAQNYLKEATKKATFKSSSGTFLLDGEEITLQDVNFIRNFEINKVDLDNDDEAFNKAEKYEDENNEGDLYGDTGDENDGLDRWKVLHGPFDAEDFEVDSDEEDDEDDDYFEDFEIEANDDNEVEVSDKIDIDKNEDYDEVSNEDNADNEENVELESFKEKLRFTPKTPHGSNLYNNFAKCLNNLSQNYFDMTGAFNDEASETLKLNLYFACRYIHVTPEGKVCADQDGKDMISSKVLETLVNFSRCNSGYKFDKYAASHDKLSEVVKFAMFNAPSSIERLDPQQLSQWYASYLELNQSDALDNLSPEIRDTLDVFVLEGREAGLFPEEETSNNNEEASSTIATSNETTSNTNDDETSNTSSESSSILARAASATVSAIGSTIKGAGKLVGKIFSFWK